MDLEEALAILEVDKTMDSVQVRTAYRDLVNVWHPDRYTHNQRLADKASEKLKIINSAYSVIQSHFKKKPHKTREDNDTKKQQTQQGNQKTHSKKEDSFLSVICKNCGTNNRIPISRSNDPTLRCWKCGKNPHLMTEKPRTNQHQSSEKSQSKKEDSFVLAICVNCRTKNRIPTSRFNEPTLRCGKCGKNPHVMADKFRTNQHQSSEKSQSKKEDPSTSVRCINCDFNDPILRKSSYDPSLRCKKCGKSPYLIAEKPHASHRQSKRDEVFVSVRCINCGVEDRILKAKSYHPSIRCWNCGKSPYLMAEKNQHDNYLENWSQDLENTIDSIIESHFKKDWNTRK